jgi:hypothetical protein
MKAAKRKITTICVIGPRAVGKTLWMTALATHLFKRGYEIYANYQLNFPFTKITDTAFHLSVPETQSPKAVFLDDMGQGASGTIHEESINKLLTLLRKYLGEDVVICFSTPLIEQFYRSVVSYLNLVIRPYLLLVDDQDKPACLHFRSYIPLFGEGGRDFVQAGQFSWFVGGVGDAYNTFEAPAVFTSGDYRIAWDKFRGYAGSHRPGVKSHLTLTILSDMGISESRAKQFASAIIAGVDPNKSSLGAWGGLPG